MDIFHLREKINKEFPLLAEYDILYILSEHTGLSAQEIKFFSDYNIDSIDLSRVYEDLQRRQCGEPLQYITGKAYFRDYEFEVGEGVLIPRPETEILVDKAVEFLKNKKNAEVCDVGTGSGAIAVSIASECGNSNVLAVDISSQALGYAEKNIKKYNLSDRIKLQQSDLFESVDEYKSFDLITANLPYVSEVFYDVLPDEVKNFEPHSALFAENEGLYLIYKCITQSLEYLKECGAVILEISPEQSRKVIDFLERSGYSDVQPVKDLTGRERFCLGRKN